MRKDKDVIKIAASILDENTELIKVPKKLKIVSDINIDENFHFINNEKEDIDDINNMFFSILNKYQYNSFDLFNLQDISSTLNIDIDMNNKKYDIDLLLYRVATNLDVPLLIDKKQTEIKSNLKLSINNLESKFQFLIDSIEEINEKIEKIENIKNEIKKENNIINKYIAESDNLATEKLKLTKINEKIDKTKKSIYEKVIIINKYIDTKLK